LGFLSLKADPDGVIRRVPLLAAWNGHFYPSLPFRVVCDYLGVPPERIVVQPGESITLKGAKSPGGKPHDLRIPIDAHGNMVINFIGPWERMKHYNFADIYHASDDREELELWAEELSGKIVIVSDVATGSTDIGPVPTDVNFPLSGLHANVIHTILTESFLRELSGFEMLLIEILLAGIVMVLSLRLSSLYFLSGTAILTMGYVGATALSFFVFSTMIQVVRPVLFLGFVTVTVSAFRYFREEKEKEGLRRSFEAYFPPLVVERLISSPDLQSLSCRKKELTILFSDIEDFTVHSAPLPPDRIQALLSEYFEAMVEIVFQFHGTVDKYIGDGLMVFFGDFEPHPDHARRCVQAAIDMQRRVYELNRKWQNDGGIPLRIRIGINTGIVAVGNLGSARRLSYTVIGAAVNQAKRMEAIAPSGSILISNRTRELIGDEVSACSLGQVTLKGVEKPVEIFEVVFQDDSSTDSDRSGEC
jgi:adenylate cyclase